MSCQECNQETAAELISDITNSMAKPSEQQVTDAAVKIMEQIQADACTYTADVVVGTATTGTVAGIVTPFGGGAYGSFSSQDVDLGDNITSIGCETVNFMAYKYAETKNALVAVMSCSCQSIDSNVSLMNNMKLNIKDLRCDSSEFGTINSIVVDQFIQADVKIVQQLTELQELTIETLLTTLLDTETEVIREEIANSAGSTDVTISTQDVEIIQNTIASSVQTSINTLKSEISAMNNGEINITGAWFSGGGCNLEFRQTIILEALVTNAMDSALSTVLKSTSLSDSLSKMTYTYTETQPQTPLISGTGIFGNMQSYGVYGVAGFLIFIGFLVLMFVSGVGKKILGLLLMLVGIGIIVLKLRMSTFFF